MAASWQVTKGIDNLRGQVNRAFPDRDKASDGTVGDLAHQLEKSDHNPDLAGNASYKDGDKLNEVRAWDMDSDLRAPGVTTQQLVDHIRHLPGVSAVLRYIIFNRKIYEASNGWAERDYNGASPHTEHVHFSGARSQAADSDQTFDYHLEELIDMPMTDAEIAKVAAATRDLIFATKIPDYADPNDPNRELTFKVWEGYNEGRHITTRAVIIAAINAAAGIDHVDEDAIITGVLAGLSAEKIAAAIPPGIATGVVDELQRRIANG